MKTDRELLELIAAQVGKLTQDMDVVKGDVKGLKSKVDSIDNTVIRIENNHGEKLSALFDGYKQNADKLERIEREVSKQEEFIMKRVK